MVRSYFWAKVTFPNLPILLISRIYIHSNYSLNVIPNRFLPKIINISKIENYTSKVELFFNPSRIYYIKCKIIFLTQVEFLLLLKFRILEDKLAKVPFCNFNIEVEVQLKKSNFNISWTQFFWGSFSTTSKLSYISTNVEFSFDLSLNSTSKLNFILSWH